MRTPNLDRTARWCEFDGVRKQVDEDLLDLWPIGTCHQIRWANTDFQRQAHTRRQRLDDSNYRLDRVTNSEWLDVVGNAPSIDAAEVENVVDDA